MIKKGALVNHLLKSGQTPLHLAVKNGRVKAVESLIKAGAHINATDEDLNTPLHSIRSMTLEMEPFYSTIDDYFATCELLIANGADVNAKNVDGKTPLDLITNEKSKFSTDIVHMSDFF